MAHILKLTVRMQRGDDSMSWGFRMAGGVDYNMPLSVQKVMPGSMAEEVGLLPGDLITAVGDPPQPALHYSHQQAQNAIRYCGNYLVMTVQRGGSGGAVGPSSPGPIAMPNNAFNGGLPTYHQQQQPMNSTTTSSSYHQQTRTMLNDAANNISQALSSPVGYQQQQQQQNSYGSPSPAFSAHSQQQSFAGPTPPPKPTGQQAFINVQYENGVPVGVQSDLRTRQNPNFQVGASYDGHNRAARPFGAPTAGRPPSGGGGFQRQVY